MYFRHWLVSTCVLNIPVQKLRNSEARSERVTIINWPPKNIMQKLLLTCQLSVFETSHTHNCPSLHPETMWRWSVVIRILDMQWVGASRPQIIRGTTKLLDIATNFNWWQLIAVSINCSHYATNITTAKHSCLYHTKITNYNTKTTGSLQSSCLILCKTNYQINPKFLFIGIINFALIDVVYSTLPLQYTNSTLPTQIWYV